MESRRTKYLIGLMLSLVWAAIGKAEAQEPPTVWGWGYGVTGALGDGSSLTSLLPVQTWSGSQSATNILATDGGERFTLSLQSDGTVIAAGENTFGQLGDGTLRDRLTGSTVKGLNGVGVLSDITAMSAGHWHGLARRSDGTLWAWGYNNSGRLGDGTTTNRTTPVQVKGVGGVGFLTNVAAISGGESHSLALKTDGTVWGWGYNANGQLGDSSGTARTTPVQVKGPGNVGFLTEVVAISAGENHSLALKADGTVWGWGLNNVGQMGDGTNTQRTTSVQVSGPGGIGFLTDIIGISAGGNQNLALKNDGTVWDWGYNNVGQLGDNTVTSRASPVQVKGPGNVGFLTNIIAVSAGYAHSTALKSDGTVWAWGWNSFGRLGDGTGTNRATPVQVKNPDGTAFLTNVTAITAGINQTTALQSDDSAWAWGYNGYGQLSDGTKVSRLLPVAILKPQGTGFLTSITEVAGGGIHSVALKSDGTVWTWGDNASGQLGVGTTESYVVPQQVKGANGVGFLTGMVAVSAGLAHSVALKADGTVWAWGENGQGQLGNSNNVDSSTPIQVFGPGGVGFLTGVIAIAASEGTSAALKMDGTVWTWGLNNVGQAGDNTTSLRLTPVQVKGANGVGFLGDVVTLREGGDHFLALTLQGTLWAWGYNANGQLGDGTITNRTTPVRVLGPSGVGFLTNVTSISGGYRHSVALRGDGSVWAWGRNNVGQLGDGTTTQRTFPVPTLGTGGTGFLTNVVSLTSGSDHNTALLLDGTLRTWGYNNLGQIGDGTGTTRTSPVQVKSPDGAGFLSSVIAVSNGGSHSLTIRGEGVLLGLVDLENVLCIGVPLTFTFRPIGGGENIVRVVNSGVQGAFAFYDIPEGNYHIAIKGDRWLQQVVPNVNTVGGNNVLNLRVFLRGGDANNDNSIDVLDLDVLIQAFDTVMGDPNWNEGADFNCDMSVDVLDLDVLLRNFDIAGDP